MTVTAPPVAVTPPVHPRGSSVRLEWSAALGGWAITVRGRDDVMYMTRRDEYGLWRTTRVQVTNNHEHRTEVPGRPAHLDGVRSLVVEDVQWSLF